MASPRLAENSDSKSTASYGPHEDALTPESAVKNLW